MTPPNNLDTGLPQEKLIEYPVLFVDDEEENREVFLAGFEDEFEVICAESGEDALSILTERKVAVMLADQRMPGMSGVELCEQVRQDHPRVIRILVTAFSDHETTVDAINRGGVLRYVSKPWTFEHLRHIIWEAITRAQLEDTVSRLRAEVVDRDRMAWVAVARSRILHDLANVDTGVAACCAGLEEILEEGRQSIPEKIFADLSEEVADLRQAVDHINGLHQRTRSIASWEPNPGLHRVRDILLAVLELVRRDLKGSIRLSWDADPENLQFFADRMDVSRMILNLVSNARQALEEHSVDDGLIEVTAHQEEREVVVDVVDNGPGVPQSAAQRVFDLFFSTRREKGGSGMGLAICRELAEANDGSVELVRTGSGGHFKIRLPASPFG